jgi:hypothetical protein
MKRTLLLLFFGIGFGMMGWGQSNYYSAGNQDVTSLSNWWSNTNGTGSNPTNFTTNNQIFNVQNGHLMTASVIWTVSGTNSKVVIQNGGQINATGFNHVIKLELQDGGSYISSGSYANLTLTASSNSNFYLNSANLRPTLTYGNLFINFTGSENPGSSNMNILGNLFINNGADFRGTTSGAPTHTIIGDIIIESGGIWTLTNGIGSPTYNITGTITNNGGTISNGATPGTSVINFIGSNVKTVTWGTKTANNFNVNIASTKTIAFSDNFSINTGTLTVNGTLDCGASSLISGTGAITLSSGATLKTAHASGLNGSITVSGTKTFDAITNYTFNGTSSQVTGTLLPATVNNFTIDNAAGVKLSNTALTVSGTMTINSGKLFTLESGKQLTVSGTLTNNATASGLVIKSDATGTGSLITTGTVSGNATVERYIPAGTSNPADHVYHVVSAPVSGQAVSLFTGNADILGFFRYDEAANLWVNSNSITPAFGTDFVVGRGYMANFETNNQTPNFVGTLQSGTITFNDPDVQEFTFSNGTYAGWGWNLIGNPYPSAIDWDIVAGWTKTNVDAAIYHRDGGSWTSYADGTPANVNIIPVGQGVFVHANAASPVLAMNNSARVHSIVAYHKEATVLENLIDITATGNDCSDHAYIHFRDQATTDFDSQFDAFKMFSDNYYYPQVFTLASDNTELSIDKREVSQTNTSVPVCFKSGLNGNYSLSFTGFDSFAPNVKFLLEDKLLSKVTDLRQQPSVQIAYTTSDDSQRFVLHLEGMVGINDPEANQQVSIYAFGDKLYLDSKKINGQVKVEVFNLTGQKLSGSSYPSAQSLTIPLQGAQGFYIVRVTGTDFIVSQKVYIR